MACLVCYSIDSQTSVQECVHLIEILKKYSALDYTQIINRHVPDVPIFVVGLKQKCTSVKCQSPKPGITELLQHVYITRSEFGSMWVGEVSAKTGKYVNELLLNIAAVLKRNTDEQDLQPQRMGIRSLTPGKTDHCVIG